MVIARPFNTYGPRQSTRAIIPTIITQIANGQKQIKLGALGPTRDLNYVADTVSGFLALADSDKANGEVVNLGSGFEISIGDLVATISKLMKADIQVEEEHQRLRPEKSEVRRLCADASKALRLTGWKSQYAGLAGLEKGLSETIAWYTKDHNLSKFKPHRYTL